MAMQKQIELSNIEHAPPTLITFNFKIIIVYNEEEVPSNIITYEQIHAYKINNYFSIIRYNDLDRFLDTLDRELIQFLKDKKLIKIFKKNSLNKNDSGISFYNNILHYAKIYIVNTNLLLELV